MLVASLWDAADDMAWLNGNCNSQYPRCDLNSASLIFSDLNITSSAPAPRKKILRTAAGATAATLPIELASPHWVQDELKIGSESPFASL